MDIVDDQPPAVVNTSAEGSTACSEFVSVPNLRIKDEPRDDTETTEAGVPLNNSLECGADPMDLLEPTNEYYNHNGMEEFQAEHEDTDSSVENENVTVSTERWRYLTQKYPWILNEGDGSGYCLYCDLKVKVNAGHLKKHALSIMHKERGDSYLAFKNSEENANRKSPTLDIKQESGTANVSTMKLTRMSLTDPLNNFNWRCWLQAHEWLVREKNEGTMGYCKYCKKTLNVEFSYIRERHEVGIKHKEAEKLYMRKCNGQNDKNDLTSRKKVNGEQQIFEGSESSPSSSSSVSSARNVTDVANSQWFEKLSNTANICRCRLCDVKIIKTSFRKHMMSKIHLTNLRVLKSKKGIVKNPSVFVKQEYKTYNLNWKTFQKRYPWLMSDPTDSSYKYCKYCEKRLHNGCSVATCMLHEKGANHKNAKKQFEDRSRTATVNGKSKKEADSEENNETDTDATDEDSEHRQETGKKKVLVNSDVWYNMRPWYQRNPEIPDYVFCLCCDAFLSISSCARHETRERHRAGKENFLRKESEKQFPKENLKRANHENTARHKEAATLHLKAESQKLKPKNSSVIPTNENLQVSLKVSSKTKEETPKSMQGKVLLWKNRFPWLSYKRSELLPNYGYCKYCEQRIYVPTLKCASKHQKSVKHIRVQVQLRRKQKLESTGNGKPNHQILSKDNQKANVSLPNEAESYVEIQKKYPWVLPDKKRQNNYGYCKYCKIRLLVKGAFKIKHQRSLKHRTAQKLYKRTASNTTTKESAMADNGAQIETCTVDNLTRTSSTVDDNVVDSSIRQMEISQETNGEVENNRRPGASHGSAVDIATRLTTAHVKMLRLVQNLKDDKGQNISFSRNTESVPSYTHQSLPTQQPAQTTPIGRNTFDLFFESVSETVKKLPQDLASEGRMKVMEIIYDLEMRALRRVQSSELLIN